MISLNDIGESPLSIPFAIISPAFPPGPRTYAVRIIGVVEPPLARNLSLGTLYKSITT